jgi:hypothetical protein
MRRMNTSFVVAATAAIGLAAAGTSAADVGGGGQHSGSSGYRLAAPGDIACSPGEAGVPPNGTSNGPDHCRQAQTPRRERYDRLAGTRRAISIGRGISS